MDTTLEDATIYQQGTYAPDDTEHRWMGSVAMDCVGNMSLGYSVSSVNVYPSIRYAGRQADDPLDALPQTEKDRIAHEAALIIAPVVAYNSTLWHEMITWKGTHFMFIEPEHTSAFSWDDLYSNLMGVELGREAGAR